MAILVAVFRILRNTFANGYIPFPCLKPTKDPSQSQALSRDWAGFFFHRFTQISQIMGLLIGWKIFIRG